MSFTSKIKRKMLQLWTKGHYAKDCYLAQEIKSKEEKSTEKAKQA